MPRIRQLDANVVNKIAAGEVIERPASVVKELLENSVDALSTRIEVEIADGGAELIRIVDDGEGIAAEDIPLAVTSHATSKIRSDDDLFRVQTMGFRGEALASIASVSRFRLRTRPTDADTGAEIEVNGGVANPVQPCSGPAGTLIEVRQLFFNTPVRRKFLRKTGTEFGHISEQFSRIAIANPRLHMVLRHNGKLVYELPASGSLIDRLRLFHGSDLADKLIEVESEVASVESAEPVRLWGYVGHPSLSKSTRKGQYLFLNGRWIQDRSLQHALGEAYRGLVMVGRFPVAFLFLELPPDLVDVNVHPTKSEVRFRDGQALYRQLLSTLRNRFLSSDLGSAFRVPERTTPQSGQTSVPNELQLTIPERVSPPPGSSPSVSPVLAPTVAGVGSPALADASTDITVVDLPTSGPTEFPQPAVVAQTASAAETAIAVERDELAASHETSTEQPAPIERIDSAADPAITAPISTALRAFQIHDCYIVVAEDEGLTVIDQHALHERIMYEHIRERVLNGSAESQKLLVPDSFEFTAREAALLNDHRDLLAELGFGIEEFGGNTMLLNSYPAMLPKVDREKMLRDIVEQLDQPEKPDRRDILDSLMHMMSCKAAIRAGHRLTREEMESLLEQRHLVDDAHHCPHGRPTALVLSRGTLDRQFGRLG